MNIKYLKYVLRHKWKVFKEGRKLGVPLWALIIHDWQKFTRTEWTAYALKFFPAPARAWEFRSGGKVSINFSTAEDFDRAWLHHLHYGPHHWQYWELRGDALEMPDRYRREMLADWRAMGDASKWYFTQQPKPLLHYKTREWVEKSLLDSNH